MNPNAPSYVWRQDAGMDNDWVLLTPVGTVNNVYYDTINANKSGRVYEYHVERRNDDGASTWNGYAAAACDDGMVRHEFSSL